MTPGVGRLVLPALCLFLAAAFGALGGWQVERLKWKRDLIERVESRSVQDATAVPDRRLWSGMDAKSFEYRRIRMSGAFLHDKETLVQALTERGGGFWLMTPLRAGEATIMVNRGFLSGEGAAAASRPAGRVEIEGLLRLSEPGGRFLRSNRPDENRWYSRDVTAIANARGLGKVAPFFVDAGPSPNRNELPIGGLTVVHFRNAHLAYALTWFALSALSAFGFVLALGVHRRGA